MSPLMRELLITTYMCMYQIKDNLVTTIQNRCLHNTIDICSNMRYHNVNGTPQTPRWGGLHMDKLKDEARELINAIDDERLLGIIIAFIRSLIGGRN